MTSLSGSRHHLDAAARLSAPVGALGGAFMLDPAVLGPGKDVGYPGGFSYYVVGRGGVLGDVDADVIVSAFGFFAPTLVRKLWEAGVVVEGPRAAADRYTLGCAQWGRTRLQGATGASRLVELLEKVVDRADASGLSLFSGWRAQPRPDDDLGRAYLLVHVFRELRGSAHLAAVLASGLTPLEAVLTNPSSRAPSAEAQAEKFGWSAPFPDVSRQAAEFEAAERLTNALVARHLEVLSASELDELTDLVDSAQRLAFSAS